MSINSVSNPYQSYTANAQNGFSQMQNDFQRLGQALQSGNMGAAQQDYSNIQQLSQIIQAYHGHHKHHGTETSPADSASSASNPGSASLLSSSSTPGANSNSGSSSDNNVVGKSMQTVISQYLSNSIVGGLLGGS
ncbi:MAG: hypothetical protein ACYCTD_07800, partial [bacterium]